MVTQRLKWLRGRSILAMCMVFSLSAHAEEGNDNEDLDNAYTPEQLSEDLNAELDDVLVGQMPKTKAALILAFEYALGDEGDADDAKERAICWNELVNEMSEAGTTVHEVLEKTVHDPPAEPESLGSDENSENRGGGSLPDFGPRPDALSFQKWITDQAKFVRVEVIDKIFSAGKSDK